MVVSIIGWYGTETMGDRAILDGIISVINELDPDAKIQLGSLYEFYTRRTLLEEKEVFSTTAPGITICTYNVKDENQQKQAIDKSDFLLIGGGPLMDLQELYLLKNCFLYAKKRGVPTAVMGCGMGPLKKKEYITVVEQIFELSTKIAFRDSLSVSTAIDLYGNRFDTISLGDPAVISVENYKKSNNKKKKTYLAVNFREYQKEEYGLPCVLTEDYCRKFLARLQEYYEEILLVPMHTFSIGGDDRYFFSKVVYQQNYKNIKVVHNPMNLHQLYRMYSNAEGCVGMRYHSVVMQTILNGNNLIMNYTDMRNGKIQGFIRDVDKSGFYADRLINLLDTQEVNFDSYIANLDKKKTFNYKHSDMKKKYANFISECLK